MRRLHRQEGLALLSALFSVALLTLIVVEMTEATFVHSHLTRNAGNAIAARLLARSGQIGAEEALRSAEGGDTALRNFVNTIIDTAPIALPTAQGHVMQIAVRDEAGRLNLNEVVRYEEVFRQLFAEAGVDPGLVDALRARVDTGQQAGLRDLSGDCALAQPCDPPRGELRSLEDLRTIRGFDDGVLARLRPYVTAHRSRRHRGEVNARTALPAVLSALGCEDTESLGPTPRSSEDVAAWLEGDPCPGAKPTPKDFFSRLYTVVTIASVGDATQAVESTIEVGRGPLSWRQRPVWGVGPGGVP